jgi:hypothetical protein
LGVGKDILAKKWFARLNIKIIQLTKNIFWVMTLLYDKNKNCCFFNKKHIF